MDVSILPTFAALCSRFASVFTRPSLANFTTLAAGWILCQARHTVSGAVVAARGLGVCKHHSVFYRLLSRARWATDEAGYIVFSLLVPLLATCIYVVIDDTLARKSGPRIWGAGMHHDPLASTYGRGTPRGRHVAFAFGHNFVVLSVWVPLPWNPERGVAIPVLFRLYRSPKRCPKSEYRKRTELASEMLKVFAGWVPEGSQILVTADHEYASGHVVKHLPARGDFTGPIPMDAAIHDLPPGRSGKRGRPHRYGNRLPKPRELAADRSTPWQTMVVSIYGQPVKIWIKTLVCLWPSVAGTCPVRVVITHDPKGRIERRAYFCTDSERGAGQILEDFARRWALEVTFRDAKQFLGFEQPQNGWGRRKQGSPKRRKRAGPQPRGHRGRKAVERTGPFVLLLYGLVHLWYFQNGHPKGIAERVAAVAPWYRQKEGPSFRDMLQELRKQLLLAKFSQYPELNRVFQKNPSLLDTLLTVAA